VFRRPDRKPYVDKGNGGASIRRAFGTECRSAGVSNLCVRDLRRVWALYDFALNRDLDKLMYRAGWRSESEKLLAWYKRVSSRDPDELREAYGRWLQHECPAPPEGRRAATPLDEAVIDMPNAQNSIARYEVRAPARLVTREEAAHYCRVGLSTFLAICPIRPISLGNSKRLERYDVRALDEWIDKLGGKGPLSSGSNWLGLVEKPNGSRAREGRQESTVKRPRLLLSPQNDDAD